MDLLFHEVPVVALLHQGGGRGDDADLARDRPARGVEDARRGPVDGHEVALVEIGDPAGHGADGQGVAAQVHLAVAIADHQGAAAPGAQDQLVLALDEDGQGEGAAQAVEGLLQGVEGRSALRQGPVDEVGDDLGVGLALEGSALGGQLGLQLGEVLDDAVVDQGHPPRTLRVGVGLRGGAVSRPAGVAHARQAVEGLLAQDLLQRTDLSAGPPPADLAALHHGHAGGVIAAVFEPPQGLDQAFLDGRLADDADDAAHGLVLSSGVPSRPAAGGARLSGRAGFSSRADGVD